MAFDPDLHRRVLFQEADQFVQDVFRGLRDLRRIGGVLDVVDPVALAHFDLLHLHVHLGNTGPHGVLLEKLRESKTWSFFFTVMITSLPGFNFTTVA
jgi:hypothetical protein